MEAKDHESPNYVRYSHEIKRSLAKEMEKEFNLVYIGGGGRMPYDVEEIEADFHAYRRVTIEEAREIEVKATERLIQLINEHKKIRPFLREYPFKSNRAKAVIAFRKPNNKCYADGSVVLIFNSKNRLHYFAEDPVTEKLIPLLDEPYEEALQIVQTNSKDKALHQNNLKP